MALLMYLEVLVVDEAGDVLAGGVGARDLLAVLVNALLEVVGDAYVEVMGAVREDVDVVVVFACGLAVGEADSSAALRNDN
jgi:hypothetical protein